MKKAVFDVRITRLSQPTFVKCLVRPWNEEKVANTLSLL